jgi:hypothetical protein
MTSDSGSTISGLMIMKLGLMIIDSSDPNAYRYTYPQPLKKTIMKTVLITGCSSGYGLETAHYFHSKGWNVIAKEHD